MTDLKVYVEIINVLSIDENEGKLRVNLGLKLGWNDKRLTFLNLKTKSALNVLNQEEYDSIWKPTLIFMNNELRDFEVNKQPLILASVKNISKFDLADYTELKNAKKYNDSTDQLTWQETIRYLQIFSLAFYFICWNSGEFQTLKFDFFEIFLFIFTL